MIGCWQGAGVEELLVAFDALRTVHETMVAEKFNHDGTYKAGINEVPRRHTGGWGVRWGGGGREAGGSRSPPGPPLPSMVCGTGIGVRGGGVGAYPVGSRGAPPRPHLCPPQRTAL